MVIPLCMLQYFHVHETNLLDGCESNQTNVTLNETTSAYTWPETDIGNLLSPCACIKRRCGGSYTYGAMWRDVENDCYNISASNVLLSICAAGLVKT